MLQWKAVHIQCTVLHTEYMAGGGKLSFQNVGGGGGEGVYDVLTLQKSRGAGSSPTGAKAPSPAPHPKCSPDIEKRTILWV